MPLRADEGRDRTDDSAGSLEASSTQAIVAIGAGLLCRRDDLRDRRSEAIETHLSSPIERERAWCAEALAGETISDGLDDVGTPTLSAHGLAELGHRDGERVALTLVVQRRRSESVQRSL